MTTSNMYVDGGTVPNQDYINFEGQSQGGYKLGLSAADGNNLGNAIIQNGEAFSPPHPVTGVRRRATHVRDGLGSTTALRPGVTIRRGFSDNAPPYTMGGALWFYDPNYNNGEGQWYNLEWGNFTNTTGWGFWDTIKTGQFAGLYKFETDLSKHPAANIASKIAGINFGNNGNIGTPQTIVLTKTDLGDPNSLPINIDVSPQGFDYLKNKANGEFIAGIYDLMKRGQVPFLTPDQVNKILVDPKFQKLLQDDPDLLPILQRMRASNLNNTYKIATNDYYSPEDKRNVINYHKKKQADPTYKPKPFELESLLKQMRA